MKIEIERLQKLIAELQERFSPDAGSDGKITYKYHGSYGRLDDKGEPREPDFTYNLEIYDKRALPKLAELRKLLEVDTEYLRFGEAMQIISTIENAPMFDASYGNRPELEKLKPEKLFMDSAKDQMKALRSEVSQYYTQHNPNLREVGVVSAQKSGWRITLAATAGLAAGLALRVPSCDKHTESAKPSVPVERTR